MSDEQLRLHVGLIEKEIDDNAEAVKEIPELDKTIRDNNEEIEELEIEIRKHQQEIKTLTAASDEQEVLIEDQKSEIENLKSKIKDLESEQWPD
jgi:seryl-tRNA synthetase